MRRSGELMRVFWLRICNRALALYDFKGDALEALLNKIQN